MLSVHNIYVWLCENVSIAKKIVSHKIQCPPEKIIQLYSLRLIIYHQLDSLIVSAHRRILGRASVVCVLVKIIVCLVSHSTS